MKTNCLNRTAFEHLQLIGYDLADSIDCLCDAPYLFIAEQQVRPCFSATIFRDSNEKLIKQDQVLKLRPVDERNGIKKMDKRDRDIYKLLSILNSTKNSKIVGYDVSWSVQKCSFDKYQTEIFPISPCACGSISMEHLEIILEYHKQHPYLFMAIGYTDWNNEKARYGTYTPCIRIS